MTAQEFLRRLRKLARKRGLDLIVNASRGKGDHSRLTLGDKVSYLPGMKGEIRTGTLRAICRHLGIKEKDL
ncbi:MAG: type II toxin-antitoxin system HicA family toxin [Geminicoccaceae bacterium]